jgi:hypothetical protein
MSMDTPWRDLSRPTEEDKGRLSRMTDRRVQALDITCDEHEVVWGFRQDRPAERHWMLTRWAAGNRSEMLEELAQRGTPEVDPQRA